MSAKKRNEQNKSLRKEFLAKPPKWRIEAVIHDGSWYDIPKWAKVAVVEEKDVEDWIKNHGDYLIKSDLHSYRTSYDNIINWYAQENLNHEENIIPSNFPPKLWNGKTEIDIFQDAPRRRVGTVSLDVESKEMLNKITNILKGVGKLVSEGGSRYRAYGLSAVHMRNLLSKGLTNEEYKSLDVKMRSVLLQRELTDLPEEWLVEYLPFYSKIFAPGLLVGSMQTINIYLPNLEDRQSYILMWVINAMKKFDETASVPFSGYLSQVLRFWPYDLPDLFLGKELAKFQRDKKNAITHIKDGSEDLDNVPIEDIANQMEISLERYLELNEQHENWLAEVNATTLTWEDSANEKKGNKLGVDETVKPNVKLMSKISLAAVKAAVDTEDWDSVFLLISQLDTDIIDNGIRNKLSKDFLLKFTEYFYEGESDEEPTHTLA